MPEIHPRSKYFLLGIVLLSVSLALTRFDSLQIGTSYDDAHYIILAESLAGGQGYQLINFPRPQVERNFPPGFPLLLAPFTLAFPENYDALKFVSLALWLSSIFLVHKLFAKRLDSPYLEILTALVALNPLLIGSSVTVMSESAYLFFSLLVFVVFDRIQETAPFEKPWLMAGLTGLLAYSFLIRTIGLSLAISLSLFWSMSGRARKTIWVIIALAAGIFLQTWINLRNGGTFFSSGYEAQVLSGSLAGKIPQVWSNASGYFDEVLAGSLIPVFGTRLDESFGGLFFAFNLVVLLIAAAGFFAWKPKLEWTHLYFVVYVLGILAFWNPQVGSVKARFLIPILPLLYFYFLVGMKWLTKDNRRTVIGASALIAFILLARNIQDWRSPVRETMTDLSIGANWVAENAPPDAIVMVNEPVPAYIHAKHRTINFPKNGQKLQTYLDNQGIDYIIIAPPLQSPRSMELDKIPGEALSILEASPKIYKLVFMDDANNTRVYEYLK